MRPRPVPRSRRGSLLIVAMLLSAIIGVSLVSYLQLSRTTLNVATRSFLQNSAVNLAESGLEQAMYCLNQNQANGVALATAWPDATWAKVPATHVATATFSFSSIAPNASGAVRVYVLNYDLNGAPVIVSKSTVTTSNDHRTTSKYLKVELSRRSLWGYGLVGKTWVHLNSNAKADSWISDPDLNAATAAVAYSAGVRRDNGSVGSVSAANGAVALDSNAEIYGTANTGGGTVSTNSNVRIYGATTPAATKVDTSRVHTDFTFTFPTITVPTPTTVNTITTSITGNTTLPRGTDVVNAADGKYYYNFAIGKNINMDSNKTLTITNSVVLIFANHAGVASIHTSSNANFAVTAGKTVDIYTNGNISLDSNNNLNLANEAKNLTIYGTATTSQTFTLSSNVKIYGGIYAPNATFQIDSNCHLYGAVIANTIQMDSNSGFHYDESLANVGGSGGYRIGRWKELQSADERAPYEALLPL